MEKYMCEVCGYVYDPEKGDTKGRISAGKEFSELPETWECPVCGVTKRDFQKM